MESAPKMAKKPLDRCNLIINYLPQDMDDNALRALFQEHGEIVHAKVVRDRVTKKSLGFGFVKFMTEQQATAAIQTKNGFHISNKRLKVSIARPSSEEIRNCKLYVTNLPKTMADEQVMDLFGQYGEIIECRVLKDKDTGGNRGVAFVQFNVRSEANRALALHGQMLDGSERPLIVKFAEDQHKKKDRRSETVRVTPRGRLDPAYVGRKLPQSTVAAGPTLSGYARQSSYLTPTMNYTNPSAGQLSPYEWYSQVGPMGYPQVAEYAPSRIMYEGAIAAEPMAGGVSSVTAALSNLSLDEGVGGQPVTLMVSNLPPNADVTILHSLFSPYGRIISAEIDVDRRSSPSQPSSRQGLCSGRGRVQMADYAQAAHAMRAVNGMVVYDRLLQVDIVHNDVSTMIAANNMSHGGMHKTTIAPLVSSQSYA